MRKSVFKIFMNEEGNVEYTSTIKDKISLYCMLQEISADLKWKVRKDKLSDHSIYNFITRECI